MENHVAVPYHYYCDVGKLTMTGATEIADYVLVVACQCFSDFEAHFDAVN